MKNENIWERALSDPDSTPGRCLPAAPCASWLFRVGLFCEALNEAFPGSGIWSLECPTGVNIPHGERITSLLCDVLIPFRVMPETASSNSVPLPPSLFLWLCAAVGGVKCMYVSINGYIGIVWYSIT